MRLKSSGTWQRRVPASLSFNELFELIPDKSVSQSLQQKVFDTRLTYGHIKGSPELKQVIAQLTMMKEGHHC